MTDIRITYHDAGPDKLGRRYYTLTWYEPDGVFRPEPMVGEQGPVGFRRGQCFFADPQRDIDRGAVET